MVTTDPPVHPLDASQVRRLVGRLCLRPGERILLLGHGNEVEGMGQRVSLEAGGVDAPRRALLVMGTAGAATLVSGCAVYGRESAPPAAEPTRPASNEGSEESGGGAVARAADVPSGGGLIVGDLVITQPASGEFRGFTTTCTHQGCAVTSVSDGTINCPCHGSRFSIEDGSVVQAAAGLTPQQQSPLPAVDIRVDGDTIARR